MKSMKEQMEGALAALPASDRAEILAEVTRRLKKRTAPARPNGRDAAPAFDLPVWQGRRTDEVASPAEVRWRLVMALLAFDAGRALAYANGYAIARRTAGYFFAPGRMVREMIAVVYPGAAGDRALAILGALPIDVQDSLAHDVLRCLYSEAVPGLPEGVIPFAVERWRVDLADALLRSDLAAASDLVRRAPRDLSAVGWHPLSVVPFAQEDAQ
jgi:hypothetical protein